jgi:septal ring factor EnvC (AmiA/AmiB activator)
LQDAALARLAADQAFAQLRRQEAAAAAAGQEARAAAEQLARLQGQLAEAQAERAAATAAHAQAKTLNAALQAQVGPSTAAPTPRQGALWGVGGCVMVWQARGMGCAASGPLASSGC